MNTAMKIEQKFEDYMQRFFYRTKRRAPFVEEEPFFTVDDVVVARRPLPIRATTYKSVRRHVMANTNDLLNRRDELSEKQNQTIDRVLYMKWLAANKKVHEKKAAPCESEIAKPSMDLLDVHTEPVVVKQEDPKEIKRRARAALSNRSDSQRVVDRYIKENKKELLARRHELSAEQNEAIDIFLRLELLADKNV